MNSLLNAGKILAIQLFFGMTFFLAATPKWRVGVTPGFRQQFSSTWLAHLRERLVAVCYFLAISESVAVLGLLVGLLTGEILPGKSKRLLKLSLNCRLFVFSFPLSGRADGQVRRRCDQPVYFAAALLSFREKVRAGPVEVRT